MRSLLLTFFIWALCFTAITVGAVLTYQWYSNRGPLIYISFSNVDGLVPSQSKIFYKGVVVGLINDTHIDAKQNAMVVARLVHGSKKFIGKESKFWLVQPELSLGKISNLTAISSGNYIEVLPVPGDFVHDFVGLDYPAQSPKNSGGFEIVLRTSNLSGITKDSPILFRGVQIGEISSIDIAKNKAEVAVNAYIYRPYINLIRNCSIFANISGFHANIQLFGGSEISLDSIRTLVVGGVSLLPPNLQAPLAKPGDAFKLLTPEQYEAMQKS